MRVHKQSPVEYGGLTYSDYSKHSKGRAVTIAQCDNYGPASLETTVDHYACRCRVYLDSRGPTVCVYADFRGAYPFVVRTRNTRSVRSS